MNINATRDRVNLVRVIHIILAGALIALLLAVSVPLTIRVIREGGGPWGFGMIGLHVLMPLNFYFIFAVAAFQRDNHLKRQLFVFAHVVSVSVGLVTFYIFPVLPMQFFIIPLVLAAIGIIDRRRLNFYLFSMIGLAIVANIVLLKWELDFGRTIPVIELFRP